MFITLNMHTCGYCSHRPLRRNDVSFQREYRPKKFFLDATSGIEKLAISVTWQRRGNSPTEPAETKRRNFR